jgi:hypothetical protein
MASSLLLFLLIVDARRGGLVPWENFDIRFPGGESRASPAKPPPKVLSRGDNNNKSTDVDRDGTNILSHDTVRSGTWFSVQDSQSKSRTCCILLSMWKHSTNILLLVLVGTADVLESL